MVPAELTVADLIRRAREHRFELFAASKELDKSDSDFVVAHAEDVAGVPWVLKAPGSEDVIVRADIERRVLNLVQSHLPVAVPDWRLFAPDLIAHPRMAGAPAAVVDLELGDWRWRFSQASPPELFLESLAVALAGLHRIDSSQATAEGVITLRIDDLRAVTSERIDQARDGLNVPDAVWRRWHEWITDDSCWPSAATLVHGDLQPGHILVDEEHRVVGLTDWSEAHVGDPATDFSLLYASIGFDALKALIDRYGAAGAHVWPKMAHHVVERWVAYPAVIAGFARTTGNDESMQLAQALVDETAALMSGRL